MIDDQKHTGITIMLMNEQMDHGPIITQKEVDIVEWPVYEQFEEMMAIAGAHILEDTIPKWVNGELKVTEQDHSHATYTKKIKKEDGLIDISNLNDPKTDQYLIFRKIQAYHEWPQAYFLTRRNGHEIRVKITSATFNDGKLTIVKVIPEGSKEMLYEDFLRGLK
jgi:methionyl-tRNA formyltransferase